MRHAVQGLVAAWSLLLGHGGVRLGRRDVVGKGNVSAGSKTADVGAVFVFDPEEGPDGAPADFGEGDEEGEGGAVLEVLAVDGVEDPVEAEDGVEEHGGVVDPGPLVAEHVSQEGVFGVRVAETWEGISWCNKGKRWMDLEGEGERTPVHSEIPDRLNLVSQVGG